ncbi:MAG: hypothetical protein BMS9Abin29_0416 [Gemmatimonadota bacterium]|nr:MAG: hypothetical protein BMS9Abin29_0416 [Gemmatimonadota bacterium]
MHDNHFAAECLAAPDRYFAWPPNATGPLILREHVRSTPLVTGRRGFTLVEAIIALTISTLLVGLVTSVFLAQNSFYASVAERGEVQDNLRSITQLIASEARAVAPGGVIVADSTRFAIRVPMRVAGLCAGGDRVRIPRFAQMSTADMSGYAIHDGSGNWDFRTSTWAGLFDRVDATAAGRCADNGADTAGIVPDFVNLTIPDPMAVGDVVMIYREVEFLIAVSTLDPTRQGLFRGPYGGSLVEFASGLTNVTHFQYRLGTSTYQTSVAPANLQLVDGVRLIAVAESNRTATGGYAYGWTVDIPLKNSR